MGKTDVEFTGMEELERLTNPRSFSGRLQREVGKATKKNALVAQGVVQRSIHQGEYTANSPVTAAIKGSGRPLVDKGSLVQSITGQAESWDEAVVGVLRSRTVTDASGRTKDVMNIAKILHEGATIRVTPKMRKYMAMMSRLHPGKYRPIKRSTEVIVIPPRPFLKSALNDKTVKVYRDNWQDGVARALFNSR